VKARSDTHPVNRFALFRRVMGNMTLTNTGEAWKNFAHTSGQKAGASIEVYQIPKADIDYWVFPDGSSIIQYEPQVLYPNTPNTQPAGYIEGQEGHLVEPHPQFYDNTYDPTRKLYSEFGAESLLAVQDSPRQAVMTPNNLIHELGHALDGRAGFGVKGIGSIEYEASVETAPVLSKTRTGMGPTYLENLTFYEHDDIVETSPNVAGFQYREGVLPQVYDENGYLMYDLFGTAFDLWNNNDYNIYRLINGVINMHARIDTFVQNPEDSYTETVADAFLNWVRQPGASGDGLEWFNFLEANMGISLRNAVMYKHGNVQFYKDQRVINTPLFSSSKGDARTVRLYPTVNPNNVLGSSDTYLDAAIDVFGLLPVPGGLGEGSNYWLVVADKNDMLVWVASQVIDMTNQQLDEKLSVHGPVNSTLADTISPDRPYMDTDLDVIIG
jgi:hypothetical protein